MFSQEKQPDSIVLYPLTSQTWEGCLSTLSAFEVQWLKQNDFSAKAGQICTIPDSQGNIGKVMAGYDPTDGVMWALGALPRKLPVGHYHLVSDWSDEETVIASTGWGLGCYQFKQFTKTDDKSTPQLYVAKQIPRIEAVVQAFTLVRDLINTPANHMMPEHLAATAEKLAVTYGARFQQIIGEELLVNNYPMIHAVGRASVHAPRLLELEWGNSDHPAITLVGKGVCFDTGGLDLKSSFYMRLMKKDMGGAAHALGLAQLIMQLNLPVHLQVLIPAVDNAVSGNAFRPGDVVPTRAGKQIEIDNTDAEGRLVLCDALTKAVEHKPQVIIDFATLTGAARTALGTEIPVYFCNNTELTAQLEQASIAANELIWRLPLHKPYFHNLKSKVADFANSGGSYGGAIIAALYLNEFVPESIPWAHFDIMAWNNRERPGRPMGGEAMSLLTVFTYIEQNFSN